MVTLLRAADVARCEWRAVGCRWATAPGKLVANPIYDCFPRRGPAMKTHPNTTAWLKLVILDGDREAIMVAATTGRSGDRIAIGRIAERAGGPRGNRSLTRFAPLMKPQSFSMHRGRRRAQMVPAPHPKKTPLDGARCRLS
jgi:hypothetical protein